MYGLVFAGGGARGAYQIGVWKALREMNIDIKIVCGTSVGALNGAFVAQNKYQEALDMWENMKMSTVFRDEESTLELVDKFYKEGIKGTNFDTVKKVYSHITKNKGLNVDPLRELIESLLDEQILKDSGIEFGLVTFNITEKKPQKIYASDLEKDELKYYLLGSALFPGFNQDKTHNVKFFDGGLIDNMPIKMVRDKGFENIIAVNLRSTKTPKYKDVNLTYICPSEHLGSILHFNKERSLINIEMGYLDALKAFNQVFGNQFYFTDVPKESSIVNSLTAISSIDRERICDYLGIKQNNSDRYLFEKCIPKLSKKLGIKESGTYSDLIYGIIEMMMKELNKDRLVLYRFQDVINVILEHDFKENDLQMFQSILKAIL